MESEKLSPQPRNIQLNLLATAGSDRNSLQLDETRCGLMACAEEASLFREVLTTHIDQKSMRPAQRSNQERPFEKNRRKKGVAKHGRYSFVFTFQRCCCPTLEVWIRRFDTAFCTP